MFIQIVSEYKLYKEEITNKVTENELTIKNLREEVEKLNNKIQEQQKQQVILIKIKNHKKKMKLFYN